MIPVYSENHTKPVFRPTLCGKTSELLDAKVGGTYN